MSDEWRRQRMLEIYESLDWNFHHHLRQADSIARTMMSEMSVLGVPTSMYVPFMQEKFLEILQKINAEAGRTHN
ncbi:hypothetical protein J31TS4_18740 [Paenibacillus sp. J31TS4]|uniref:hypothetical protein n=1 Tax=Paenibacillus sp. J31TS4 TaxID=2807195 RepID=UPI001B2000E1|nr:hypothetical protein [Paenibacillus sp. J31TS4]GIP38594.1 hypothetical protein J31TS4_18740 [Paenibacillus sp. J31TS4]